MLLWLKFLLKRYISLCLQKLLEFYAPMMPRADDGQTPLDLAMRYNRQDCIPLLSMESPAHIHIV